MPRRFAIAAGPNVARSCLICAASMLTGRPYVLAGGLRLGDALALPLQHDFTFPRRHACQDGEREFAGRVAGVQPLRRQGRASRIMLNGVSVARRILVKPPAVMTSRSLASPACAPSAEPTSCDSEVGTQIIVEAA